MSFVIYDLNIYALKILLDFSPRVGSLLQTKLINVNAPPKQESPKKSPNPPPRADIKELLSWM